MRIQILILGFKGLIGKCDNAAGASPLNTL